MKKLYPFILAMLFIQSCKAQQSQSDSPTPKIENYSNGELEIMVTPFGLDSAKIKVGNISEDGGITFSWPSVDISTIENSDLFMSNAKRALGAQFCKDPQLELSSESAQVVAVADLSLFKEGKYIGALYPATDIKLRDNNSLNRHTSLVLGSSLHWYLSDSDVALKATCTENVAWENSYDFEKTTSYDIQFNKGWNLVKHTLIKKEDWKNETDQGSLPKVISKSSIIEFPSDVKWYVKLFGQ